MSATDLQDPDTRTFKIVLIGDSGVGKSCLIERVVRNVYFDNNNVTIGAAFLRHEVKLDGISVRFHIWDTAGQEKYRSLGPIYYRGSHAAIVVYDVTNNSSFENIDAWIHNIRAILGDEVLVALVGKTLSSIITSF